MQTKQIRDIREEELEEEGEVFVSQETHKGYIDNGYPYEPVNSLIDRKVWCVKCWREVR